MLISLLFGSILMTQTTRPSMFSQVVAHPTGKNGYEELVMAADLLQNGRFSRYDAWARVEPERNNEMDAVDLQIYAELKGKSTLQKLRLITEKFGRVRDLLSQAAQKPIFDPRESLSFDTLMPELSGFRSIAHFIQDDAYCAFADGQGQQAVNELKLGFDVFDRASRGMLIEYLVGVACQSILLATVEDQLPRLSQRDAKVFEQASASNLGRPPAIVECMDGEYKFMRLSLEKALDSVHSAEAFKSFIESEELDKAMAGLKKMTSADFATAKGITLTRLDESHSRMHDIFTGPESGWATTQLDEPTPPNNWSTPTGLGDAIANMVLPAFSQLGKSAARNRTQIRLLGLVSTMISYRWENGKLPDRLSDAVGEARANDPLSGEPFEYKLDHFGGFTITSKGTKETGTIALRYKRAEGNGDPGPPTMAR